MSSWILIVVSLGMGTSGMDAVEFSSLDRCEIAKVWINSVYKGEPANCFEQWGGIDE